MRKILHIVFCLLALLVLQPANADVAITLKNGQTIAGNVVFQNDEVIVIKDYDGQRFQYPRAEIDSINNNFTPLEPEEQQQEKTRKVALNIKASGGVAIVPHNEVGGMFSIMAHVGACNVANKRLFIGGGIGYFGTYMSSNYAFMPIVFRVEAPLTTTKSAPFIGASFGYGIAPKKNYKGGLHGQVDAGWRRQLGKNSALLLALNASVQQGSAMLTEDIEGEEYTQKTTLTFCTIGASIAIQF